LRARIVALAHRHRRYGIGMNYLKLRQAGEAFNYTRVERLYVAERLQVRRRRRKKVPAVDRQPLARPTRPNEVWSADFVFDRMAEGRVLKCLAIVDDTTTEAVAVVIAQVLQWHDPEGSHGRERAHLRPAQLILVRPLAHEFSVESARKVEARHEDLARVVVRKPPRVLRSAVACIRTRVGAVPHWSPPGVGDVLAQFEDLHLNAVG
jgi:hypothetical protein